MATEVCHSLTHSLSHTHIHTHTQTMLLYRVIHELWKLLQEINSWVFLMKTAPINMDPTLSGYGATGVL